MSIQLVIAEKPSVARSIAGVIGANQKRDGYMEGNGYLVSWCIGHLVSLADAAAYDERFKKWRYGGFAATRGCTPCAALRLSLHTHKHSTPAVGVCAIFAGFIILSGR